MKTIRTTLLGSIVVMLFATIGCTRSEVANEDPAMPPPIQVLKINENEGVEVEDLAAILSIQYIEVRSGERQIKNILPILGNNGDTLIFAINYQDDRGFTLISASRNYYPILAQIDRGNYSPTGDSTGFDIWLDETKQAIAVNRKSTDTAAMVKYRRAWLKYATLQDLALTKSGDVFDLLNSSMSQWRNEGYEVIMYRDFLNSYSFSQELKDQVTRDVDMYANHTYDKMVYAFVLVKDACISNTKKGPLLQTAWDQKAPFNNALNYIPNSTNHVLAGCVNIAVGQIMKYHQYPTSFNWAQIDRNADNAITASFIAQLYAATQSTSTSTGTGSTIYNAQTALSGYGYSSQLYTGYNKDLIIPNINSNRPILMRGANAQGTGHQWVCDGYDNQYMQATYVVKGLEDCPSTYTPTKYLTLSTYTGSGYFLMYSSMNWGWNSQNGWYLEGFAQYYDNSRKMLVNLFPAN